MQHFNYEKTTGATAAVGAIVLQQDETLEPELRHWLPATIRLYHTRIPSDPEVTEETLARMEHEIPAVTRLFPLHADLGVVAYACTSGSTVIGETVVEKAVQSVLPEVRVTNPLTAVKAKLGSLKAKRIAMLTPYEPSVSQRMVDHFEKAGFEFVASGSFFEAEEKNVAKISDQSVRAALTELGQGDCDAVFASCTNLPTATLIDQVSAELGKPVISSNSALAWHMEHLSNSG